jgi:hypothetical protein
MVIKGFLPVGEEVTKQVAIKPVQHEPLRTARRTQQQGEQLWAESLLLDALTRHWASIDLECRHSEG